MGGALREGEEGPCPLPPGGEEEEGDAKCVGVGAGWVEGGGALRVELEEGVEGEEEGVEGDTPVKDRYVMQVLRQPFLHSPLREIYK